MQHIKKRKNKDRGKKSKNKQNVSIHFFQSPNACNSWGWVRWKPEATNSMQVFWWWLGTSTWPFSATSQLHWQEVRRQIETGLNPSHSNAGCKQPRWRHKSVPQHLPLLNIFWKNYVSDCREEESETNISHPLAGCPNPATARQNLGVGNSTQVTHMDRRPKLPEPSLLPSGVTSSKLQWRAHLHSASFPVGQPVAP